MLKITKNDAMNDGLLSLDKGKELVEARFSEIANFVTQLTLDDDIQTLFNMRKPLQTSDYYLFLKVQKKLSNYMITNSFIDDIYIRINQPNAIVSSKYASDNMRRFYKDTMYYTDMNYSEWERRMTGDKHDMDIWPASPVMKENSMGSYITYVQSYPIGSGAQSKGAVVVQIKEEKFHEYFNNLDIMSQGMFVVLDHDRNILTSMNYNTVHTEQDNGILLGQEKIETGTSPLSRIPSPLQINRSLCPYNWIRYIQ